MGIESGDLTVWDLSASRLEQKLTHILGREIVSDHHQPLTKAGGKRERERDSREPRRP